METMDKLSMRGATPADYAAVVRMSEGFFGGFDYIESIYMDIIHNSDVEVWVAELDGQIVSAHEYSMYIIMCNTTDCIQITDCLPDWIECHLVQRQQRIRYRVRQSCTHRLQTPWRHETTKRIQATSHQNSQPSKRVSSTVGTRLQSQDTYQQRA